MSTNVVPSFKFEADLYQSGFEAVVGVDEVGCGALAGPVVAAAVLMPKKAKPRGIRDSKLLSAKQREDFYSRITHVARAWSVGVVEVDEIFDLGIRPATYLAMRRAIDQITFADFVLVDAWTLPQLHLAQRGIIHGDRLVLSIAAASILAKVTRDKMMEDLHEEYPDYGFAQHKGYGTREHQVAIKTHGPCPIHRLGYKIFEQALI